jgi:glycosyltransferase involved in cell wall biosynthesis
MYFWRDKSTAFRWLRLRARLREGFDAVIVQHTPTASGPLLPFFLRAARRLGVPAVVVAHEMPSVYAKHLPRFARPLYHAYERAVMALATARVVQADLYVAELRAIGVQGELAVIPVPAYASRFPVPPLDGERPCWGYYGMISPKKGVDLLLATYQSRPPGRYPPLRLLGGAAPGNEAYFESLKAGVSAAHRPFIDFRGYVEDAALPGELARIALVILPYRWASQSAVLTEALRHHAPYLASDLPFFTDFRKRYGCGEVFRSGSVEDLARALDKTADNAADPLLAGRPAARPQPFEEVLADLSLTRCADKLLDVVGKARATVAGSARR